MVDVRHNRLPVRLVQENGNTIPLNVTAYDITVERNHSQIPIPFANSKRLGIDLNMPQISVALTGVITDDDEVVEETSGAVGKIDVGFQVGDSKIQSTGMQGNTLGFGLGGSEAPPTTTNTPTSYLPTSYISNPVGPYITDVNDLHGKYFELPVAYWGGVGGPASFPTAPTLNPTMWLNAGSLSEGQGDYVQTWTDTGSNEYSPTQSTLSKRPQYIKGAFNDHPVLSFTASSSEELVLPYTAATNHALSSAEVTIFVVSTGESGYYGWGLKYRSASDFEFNWGNGPGSSSFTVDTDSAGQAGTHLISVVLEDTTDDNVADEGSIYRDGKLEDTASGVYTPMTGSQNIRIGYNGTDYFDGEIGEVIIYNRALTDAERQATEAYLAGKYSLQLDSDHPYYRASNGGNYHIRYVFDAERQGSVREPWAFVNSPIRTTNLTVTNVGGTPTAPILTVDNDPREWIESVDLENIRLYNGDKTALTTISAVSSTTITLDTSPYTFSISDTLTLLITTNLYSQGSVHNSSGGLPVIAIPIADLFNPPSTYNNGSTRDLSGAGSPIEYLATKIAKAITLTDSLGSKVINPDNDGTSSADAFTVSVTQSEAGSQRGLVTITQKVHGAFLVSKSAISHNFPMPTQGQAKPLFSAFTGGRISTLEKRKSAGDRAQDLIGLVNNMNNWYQSGKGKPNNALGDLVDGMAKAAKILGNTGQRDYIEGIQIPYLSACLPTKGQVGIEVYIADAVPSGSSTVITTLGEHKFLVGDQIVISNFSILGGTMAVNLNGDHTVSVVASDTQFTISTASTSNTGSAGGLCNRKTESNNKLQWEQRNFFITSGVNPSYANVSSDNHNTLASKSFNRKLDDHRQSGMRTVIDEFTVDFKAEDRIYAFDMTMIAVDYLV